MENVPCTIVGVAPPGFYGLLKGSDPDLYVPFGSAPELFGGFRFQEPMSAFVKPFGRLRPGVTLARARSDLAVLWKQVLAARMIHVLEHDRIDCEDGSHGYAGIIGERRHSLNVLSAIVALLLLIGCANVGCLLIARGAARRHETAIRLSLGASRGRVLRESLVESVILALAGGAAAMAVAHGAGLLLLQAFHWQERPIDLTPDGRVLAFALAVSLVSAILFGIAPALQLLRGERAALARSMAAPFLSGKVLVALEVALSLVLVAGAAVFARSLQNLRSVPTGFLADHVSVIRLARPAGADDSSPVRDAMELMPALRQAPGVRSATLLLIASGLYGLMAHGVARRTREIGIRMAVGSSTAALVKLVIAQALRPVAAGIVLGIPGAVIVMRAISGLVFGLRPVDPASLWIAAGLLALTGLAAGLLPAWRAAHLDPVKALWVQ